MGKKSEGRRSTLEKGKGKRKKEDNGGDTVEVQRKRVKRRRVKRTMPTAHKKKDRAPIQGVFEDSGTGSCTAPAAPAAVVVVDSLRVLVDDV